MESNHSYFGRAEVLLKVEDGISGKRVRAKVKSIKFNL